MDIDENLIRNAKAKLENILSERQKKEILEKIKSTDKEDLLKILSSDKFKKLTNEDIEKVIKSINS